MSTQPYVSIVIPTRNRPAQLAECLDALGRLDYPRERYDVIVVDDGGLVPLDPVLQKHGDPLCIRLARQASRGPAAARNAGAALAGGAYLAFVDDDCAPDVAWLRVLAERVSTAPDALLGGSTVNALARNPFSTASQELVSFLYRYFNDSGARFFTSNNMVLPAARFRELGGFDTRYPLAAAEDRDLCDRWRARGWRMLYVPEAMIRHAHTLTLRSFWRQHFRYGRGAYRFHRGRALRQGERLHVEPARFYVRLLGEPLAQRPAAQALPIIALLSLAQGANAAGFGWEYATQLWHRGHPSAHE